MTRHETTCPECGAVFEQRAAGKARSYPQLKRYFKVIREAFRHWPHGHRFRPRNEEHLRGWLECEAGHCTVETSIRCQSVDPIKLYAVLKAVMETSEDVKQFVEMDDDLIIVRRALSISYGMLEHLAACSLFNDVYEVIYAELGIDDKTLLEEAAKAA